MAGEPVAVTPSAPPEMGMIPPMIGTETPPVVEAPAEPSEVDRRIAALEANLASTQAQNVQLMQLAMRPQQAAPAPPAPPAEFDLDGLPDPVSAPKDFTTQLTQRIRQRDAQRDQHLTQNITTQVARGAAMDSLYNRFTTQQPELSKRGALLQGAAAIEFQNLHRQGIDPIALAQQSPDSLIAAIAQRMNADLGIAAAPAVPSNNAARVAGIQGGSQGNGVKPPAAPAVVGFNDQIKAQQKKMGLI